MSSSQRWGKNAASCAVIINLQWAKSPLLFSWKIKAAGSSEKPSCEVKLDLELQVRTCRHSSRRQTGYRERVLWGQPAPASYDGQLMSHWVGAIKFGSSHVWLTSACVPQLILFTAHHRALTEPFITITWRKHLVYYDNKVKILWVHPIWLKRKQKLGKTLTPGKWTDLWPRQTTPCHHGWPNGGGEVNRNGELIKSKPLIY